MDVATQKIIGAAIEVHRILSPGLLEMIYSQALAAEFEERGIQCEREVEVDVEYKGRILKGQRIDLLVEKQIIVELKSVRHIPEIATAQVLSYLKATGLRRALIINFGEKRLVDGVQRISL
ncbi:MAG: GxxExxY protein [Ignavibacteriales bacterium]|nr:GxxExxY protein [Ignavibacteriales bacterium]